MRWIGSDMGLVLQAHSHLQYKMSVLSKLFTPSGKKFYDLFEQVTTNLTRLSAVFQESFSIEERVKRKNVLDKIESLEQRNDEATHRLFVELSRNYITPFDREDIHFMASSLDDIADYMWGTAKQMYYFDISPGNETSQRVAETVILYTQKLAEAIKGLRNQRELNAMIAILKEMRTLTSKVDDEINNAQFSLLNTEMDIVEQIKLTDHYAMLQKLNDKCSEVINVLEGIVIKYG